MLARVPAPPKPFEKGGLVQVAAEGGSGSARALAETVFLIPIPEKVRRSRWARSPAREARALPQKNLKKVLPCLRGIVKNGVILRVLGGTMRKFKTCSRRSLPFRLLVILAGALLLLAAFAPRANADLLRFYDFEGPASPPFAFGLHSNAPALEQGPAFDASLRN